MITMLYRYDHSLGEIFSTASWRRIRSNVTLVFIYYEKCIIFHIYQVMGIMSNKSKKRDLPIGFLMVDIELNTDVRS